MKNDIVWSRSFRLGTGILPYICSLHSTNVPGWVKVYKWDEMRCGFFFRWCQSANVWLSLKFIGLFQDPTVIVWQDQKFVRHRRKKHVNDWQLTRKKTQNETIPCPTHSIKICAVAHDSCQACLLVECCDLFDKMYIMYSLKNKLKPLINFQSLQRPEFFTWASSSTTYVTANSYINLVITVTKQYYTNTFAANKCH